MKVNMIYFSPTGNTRKAVRAIGKSIAKEKNFKTFEYNITFDKNIKKKFFSDDDIVVIGVPAYAGRVPELIENCLKSIKSEGAYFLPIVTYGNRDMEDTLIELSDIFEKNGFKMIGFAEIPAEHSYTQELATGRPNEKDLEELKEFGIKIAQRLENKENLKFEVPGNRPYRERQKIIIPSPVTSDRCTFCGICIIQCPVDAIDHLNPKKINENKCIHCCGCIKRCPEGAKSNEGENFEKIKNRLENNFKKEKEMKVC